MRRAVRAGVSVEGEEWVGDLSGLLPDGRIVLHGEDRLPLLLHTRSAALAGSLGSEIRAGKV